MDQTLVLDGSELTSRHSLPQLATQHSQLEIQLKQLSEKRYLSPEEELERQRLKKLKLHLKDEMELVRRQSA